MSQAVTALQAGAVALGAAAGALLRWFAGMALNGLWAGFPLGTLLVTGLLGGFTTFSSFSAESLGLVQRGELGLALLHSAAHLLGALACTALGYGLARVFLR